MMRLRTLGVSEIQLGDRRLGPSSGRPFAFLLFLAFDRGRSVSRSVLRDLLFPNADEQHSLHSMRQLLYQVRQLGARLVVHADTVLLPTETVADDLGELQAGTLLSDAMIQAVAKGFLPGYSPSFSEPFNAWLDGLRRQVHVNVLQRLLVALDRARAETNWERLAVIARACLAYDPLHHEATLALAQALAMVGSNSDALLLLDQYRSELDEDLPELRKPAAVLRRRIAENRTHSSIGEAPFVGRVVELAQLRRLFRETREGKGRLVVLQGEPGIGKSRLAAEVAKIAALEGSAVCRVNAQPRDRGRPFSVFGELVASMQLLPGALGCAPESLALLRRFIAPPRGDSGVLPEEMDYERLSAAIARSVTDLFNAVTLEQHLLLVVEDGQHLDDPSRELLVELACSNSQDRLLAIITTRERALLGRTSRVVDNLVPLRVGPLDVGTSESLLLALAPRIVDADRPLIDRCLRCAGGNPFFLTVLARDYKHGELENELPSSLTDLIGRRLDQIAGSMLTVLQAVIVLGRHATIDRVMQAVELPAGELLSSLQALEESGLVVSDAFILRAAHEVLADVVMSRVPAATLRLLHLFCARILEADTGEGGNADVLWDCSDHWRLAGEPARAVSLLQSCGNHALALGQPQYGAEMFCRAAQLERVEENRAELLRQAGHAAALARDFHLVLLAVRELRNMSPHDGASEAPHDDLELHEIRAIGCGGGDIGAFVERLKHCTRASSATVVHRLDAARQLLWVAGQQYRGELAADAATAIEGITPTNELESMSQVFFNLLYALQFGDISRVVTLADILRRCAANVGLQGMDKNLAPDIAFALHYAGLAADSEESMLEAFSDAHRLGSRTRAHWCACALAEWRLDEGNLETAKKWLSIADEIQRVLPHQYFTSGHLASWIRLALLENRPDDAERLLDDAWRRFAAFSHPYVRSAASAYRVQISCLRGEQVNSAELSVLLDAHQRGRNSLIFDEIAAALWRALSSTSRQDEADVHLAEYVINRRSRSPHAMELQRALRLAKVCFIESGPTAEKRAPSRNYDKSSNMPQPARQ